jgi:hypothetical protein
MLSIKQQASLRFNQLRTCHSITACSTLHELFDKRHSILGGLFLLLPLLFTRIISPDGVPKTNDNNITNDQYLRPQKQNDLPRDLPVSSILIPLEQQLFPPNRLD